MRPSPLLLLLLVALGFGALAVPLVRLTRGAPPTPAVASPRTAGAPISTLVRIRFAHQPVRISLKQDDRVIAEVSTPADNPVELTAPLSLTDGGVELLIEATWPAGTPPTALTVELEPDGIDARAATRWTEAGTLTGVISFSWR